MNDLSIGFLLIISPEDGLSLAIYRKRVVFFIFFLYVISVTVGFSLINPFSSIGSNLVINLSFTLLWLFILSAFLHFSCEIIGGSGNCIKLFLSLIISLFPMFFITPFALISKVYGHFFLGSAFCFLWVFYLQAKFAKKLYSLSTGKIILAFILPSIFFFFVFFLLFFGIGIIGMGIGELGRIQQNLFFL